MIARRKVGWTMSVISSVCLLGAIVGLIYVNYCPKNIITPIANWNIAAFSLTLISAVCLIIGIVLIVLPSQNKLPVNDGNKKYDTEPLLEKRISSELVIGGIRNVGAQTELPEEQTSVASIIGEDTRINAQKQNAETQTDWKWVNSIQCVTCSAKLA